MRSEESVKTLDDEMMFQTKRLLFCLCERMKRKSVSSVLLKFGLSLVKKIKKKKKIRSFFFRKNGKNIFRTTNARSTRDCYYIYITVSLFIARGENYALYLVHLPLCCDSLSSRVVEVFERAVVR